jgi:hypothetical protein
MFVYTTPGSPFLLGGFSFTLLEKGAEQPKTIDDFCSTAIGTRRRVSLLMSCTEKVVVSFFIFFNETHVNVGG